MAYPLKTWDGSQWIQVSSAITDLTNYVTKTGTTGTVDFSGANFIPPTQTGFRNVIINGGMDVWQRGTSFTHTSGSFYNADRFSFFADGTGGTKVVSQQAFTPGAGSIPNFEPRFFWRFNQSVAPTSQTEIELTQPIEDVRTFAGQTVTISFWAKADASRTIDTKFRQIFGTGGSSFVDSATQNHSLTTSWQRFTHTLTVPSISGKTIGTNAPSLQLKFNFPVGVTQTIDIWGVQVEKGSVATPFEQRPIGTELALCQRYYYRSIASGNYTYFATGSAQNTSTIFATTSLPVSMRTSPAAIDIPALANFWVENGTASTTALTGVTIQATICNPNTLGLSITSSAAFTAGLFYRFLANNTTNAYLGVSAEL